MPEPETLRRARKARSEGKAPSTQASEFVREEIHHIREGKHGARSAKQAIAIGLSKARRAGVKLKPPPNGSSSKVAKTKRKISPKRSRASVQTLQREGREAASHQALSRQAKASSRKRGKAARSASANRAARTRRREAF
jgi:Family of unknown function (DUF6496)